MDWTVSATLLVLLHLEGARTVPAGSLLAQRGPLGRWRVVGLPHPGPRWRLLCWFPPLWLSIVLPPRPVTEPDIEPPPIRPRYVRSMVALGVAEAGALVLGIPFAASALGPAGLVGALLIVQSLAIGIAVLCFLSLRHLGWTGRDARRGSWQWLWPFRTPGAAALVLEASLRNGNRLRHLRHLLDAADYQALVRPLAYDGPTTSDLAAEYGRAAEEVDLRARPPSPERTAVTFCSRCGAGYVLVGGHCGDCRIPLTPAAGEPWRPGVAEGADSSRGVSEASR